MAVFVEEIFYKTYVKNNTKLTDIIHPCCPWIGVNT